MASMEEVAELDKKGEGIAAFHMLTELAQQRNVEAAYMLGNRCKGKDNLGAYIFFYIAALQGHIDAKIEVAQFEQHMSTSVIKSAHSFAQTFMS